MSTIYIDIMQDKDTIKYDVLNVKQENDCS